MMYRKAAHSLWLIAHGLLLALLFCGVSYAQEEKPAAIESDQQISEFSLAGYGEKGKKSWDIAGKTADIFGDVIKLNDVEGNMYAESDDVNLTADKGNFDKKEGKVHLEDNVVITTASGSKLTTDSLDWDRKQQLVSTDDVVNIVRDNMTTVAKGAEGQPNLSRIKFKEDVNMEILPKPEPGEETNKIAIECDGPLEIDYAKNIATFKNNVKVDTQDNLIYCDLMDVYFLNPPKSEDNAQEAASGSAAIPVDAGKTAAADNAVAVDAKKDDAASSQMMGAKIDRIVCRGNVKIVNGQNTSYSEEAVYTALDKKIVLTGRPKLVLYSTEDISASLGN